MKIRFRPAKSEEEVFLFAHRVEAIVFWMCLAGIVLFLIITLFRYYYLKPMVQEFNEGFKKAVPAVEMEKRIESLEAERSLLQERVNALLDTTVSLKKDIADLRLLHRKEPSPSPPAQKKDVIRLP